METENIKVMGSWTTVREKASELRPGDWGLPEVHHI